MSFLQSTVLGLTLPVAIAAVAAAVAGRWAGPRLAGLGLGLGYAAGHAAIAWPAFPPMDVTDRLPFLAVAAGIAGLLAPPGGRPRGVAWSLGLVLALLVVGVVLGPILRETARSTAGLGWLGALGVTVLASWAVAEARVLAPPSKAVAGPVVLIAGVSAAALLVSGSATLGLCGLALTGAVAAVSVLSWLRRGSLFGSGVLLTAATVQTSLVLDSLVYAALPTTSAILLAASPLGAWADRVGPARRLGSTSALALRLAATALPLAAALGLAWAASPSPQEY